MNAFKAATAGAAVVAVLVLFYTGGPSAPIAALAPSGGLTNGTVYYVDGPGWYWLSAFWRYYDESRWVCKPVNPACYDWRGRFRWGTAECSVANCTKAHYVAVEVLSSVLEGRCAGFTLYDYGVGANYTLYTGPYVYRYWECDFDPTLPDCWPVAYESHVWNDTAPPWFKRVGGRLVVNVTYATIVTSDIYLAAYFDGELWHISAPGANFTAPPRRVAIAIAPYDPYLTYHVYRWLVYVPEGCRLYVPYPYAATLTVVPPRG